MNGDRRLELLERYGRFYGEEHLAINFTAGVDGDDAKRCTVPGWPTTPPLASGDFGAAYVRNRGERRNPVIVVRPSGLVSLECDGPDELAMIEQLELPATVTVCSSAPDRLHFHFRPAAELETLPFVAFRFESGRVSADSSRYFVSPPGRHASGSLYEFLPGHGPDEIAFAELHAGVYRDLVKRARRDNGEARARIAAGGKFRHGERGDAVFRYACQQRRWFGDDEQAILEHALRFNAEMNDPPIERERVESQVHGAMKKPGGQETPSAVADEPSTATDEPAVEMSATLGVPTLKDVLAAVRRYLDLDAGEAIVFAVVLAVAVARDLDEEPLWLMLVGPSGSGKTEAIVLCKLAADGRVDELTRAGLLSWSTFGRKTRRTGLLTRIPPVAFVTISDFSTVVTMGDREARSRMFGALRVIYDGRLYRSIGGQPAGDGDELEWEGRLTMLAGATPAVDTHFSFEAALGERWLLYRLEEGSDDKVRSHARYTVDREDVGPLREHAQKLAAALIQHARRHVPRKLAPTSVDTIIDVAFLAAHARTGVQFEGTGRYRCVIGYPTPEVPTRLAGQMARLARCLMALGVREELALRIAVQAARDSIPLARRKALEHVAGTELATVSSTWRAIGRGNWYGARWELAALEAIGMVVAEGDDDEDTNKTTRVYRLADRYQGVYASVASFFTPLSLIAEKE